MEELDKDTNPLVIIQAQATKKGLQTFRVEFKQSKIINMNNITKDKTC